MRELQLNSTGSTTMELWNFPERIQIDEYPDRIEMIYKQTSSVTYTDTFSLEPEIRVFKIVFSCVDGKWNKSEPIYGAIIPAHDETYDFNE